MNGRDTPHDRISAMTEGLYRYRFIVDGVSVYIRLRIWSELVRSHL